jgi:hypothetical protein
MSTNSYYSDSQSESESDSQSESESDSSTSSTSYDPHDYVEETQSIENANKIKNILKEQLIQPIMGKPFKPLFSENEIDDSFELALLRFCHLVFSVDGVINFNNLSKFMDMNSPKCNQLYEYFMDNPGVMMDYSFYYSNAGIDIRTKWFELLCGCNFFTYKVTSLSENKKEIDPSLDNFFEFFENFFPNLNTHEYTIQERLDTMMVQLNFNFESFEVNQSNYQKIIVNTVHSSILLNFKINQIDMFILEITRLKDISRGEPVEVLSDCEFRYA